MDTSILGANIRKYRLAQNMTQKEVAEKCGLSEVYYRQIELGHKLPRLETFLRIAETLSTPTDKLLSGNVSWTDDIETYKILEKLSDLPEQDRNEALELLDYHIELLKKREH